MDFSLYPLFSFLTVFALAIITPGPNFILVVKSAMSESRNHGLSTACGVATGSLLFALAGLFGLLLVITSWPPLSVMLTYLGGAYLAWLGFTALLQACRYSPVTAKTLSGSVALSAAYRRGLLTNLTNPKAWAFYLSLFTLVMPPYYPLWGKLLLAGAMFVISLSWYAAVALLMTSVSAGARLRTLQPLVQGLLGVALLVLAGKVLLNAL